ncbi:MAG TPA: LysR family transcriptional regulator [Labilithrix sp.]|jgi:DNA-binding transcriptional LysR family regulator
MLSALDLNLLVTLEAVLAERSVAKAARALHVTPSAVSNALARLRQALGDPLVVRSGRGIVPTPRGAALAPQLTRALEELGRAVHGDAVDPATTTRRFTLAIADAGQVVQAPRLASDFAKAMPRARLRIVGIDTLLSSGGLAGTEVDLAIAAMPEPPSGVRTTPLYEEHAVLVARRDHPLARRRLTKTELAALRHVDVEVVPGRGYRELPQVYARRGIAREIALVVPSFVAAAAIVAATDFVATLPESFVVRLGSSFGLRRLAAPVPKLAVAIKLAWHERTAHDAAMKAFRDVVIAAVRR